MLQNTVVDLIIDLGADPSVPEGLEVKEHIKGGKIKFDPAKIKLHLDKQQKRTGGIEGHQLRNKLYDDKDLYVQNAGLLDFYLSNRDLIPEKWKGKRIYFWGTIYRASSGALFVRCLHEGCCGWAGSYDWLGSYFGASSPATVCK